MDTAKQELAQYLVEIEAWLAGVWEVIKEHRWLVLFLLGVIIVMIIVIKIMKKIPYKRTTITELYDSAGRRRED